VNAGGDSQVQLKDAIGSFLVEFSKFEIHSVGMALRALSQDAVFVEHAEQLLDLEARLKLLERMAFVRGASAGLVAELEACLSRARKLREHYDEVLRKMTKADFGSKPASGPVLRIRPRRQNADYSTLARLEHLWMPDLEQLQEYTAEAILLQEALQSITAKLEAQVPDHLATGTG
jgi:hypothetical protein